MSNETENIDSNIIMSNETGDNKDPQCFEGKEEMKKLLKKQGLCIIKSADSGFEHANGWVLEYLETCSCQEDKRAAIAKYLQQREKTFKRNLAKADAESIAKRNLHIRHEEKLAADISKTAEMLIDNSCRKDVLVDEKRKKIQEIEERARIDKERIAEEFVKANSELESELASIQARKKRLEEDQNIYHPDAKEADVCYQKLHRHYKEEFVEKEIKLLHSTGYIVQAMNDGEKKFKPVLEDASSEDLCTIIPIEDLNSQKQLIRACRLLKLFDGEKSKSFMAQKVGRDGYQRIITSRNGQSIPKLKEMLSAYIGDKRNLDETQTETKIANFTTKKRQMDDEDNKTPKMRRCDNYSGMLADATNDQLKTFILQNISNDDKVATRFDEVFSPDPKSNRKDE